MHPSIRHTDQGRHRSVIGEYEKVNKLNEIVKGLDAQASVYTNVDSGENIEYDELESIQQKRDNIDKEIARATVTAAIVLALNSQAVVTPGSSSKDGRYARLKPMSIPTPLEGKGADLQDMIMAYVLGIPRQGDCNDYTHTCSDQNDQ